MQTCLYFAFYFFALSLALGEAPKQLSLLLFVLCGAVWLWQHAKNIRLDIPMASLFALSLVAFISTGIALDPAKALAANMDMLRIAWVFLLFKSLPLNHSALWRWLSILLISLLLGVILGFYGFYVQHHTHLELPSVGHVNHSALYMVYGFSITLLWLLHLNVNKPFKTHYFLLLALAILLLLSIFIAGSRAAMLSVLLVLLLVPILQPQYRQLWVFGVISGSVVLVSLTVMFNPYTLSRVLEGFDMSDRLPLLYTAWYGWWAHNWWFGIGADNSVLLQPHDYPVGATHFANLPHAHNTFLTFLLERGIIGLAFYLVFIFSVLYALLQRWRQQSTLLVQIGLAVWMVNFLVSWVNTTFHNENALLMVALWGMAFNPHLARLTDTSMLYLIRQKPAAIGGAEHYLARLRAELQRRGITYQVIHNLAPNWLPSWSKALWFNVQVCWFRRVGVYFSLDRITCADVYRAGDGVHQAFLQTRRRSLNPLHPVYLWLERRCFRNAQHIIANSALVKQQIQQHYPFAAHKVTVIYNGIDFPVVDVTAAHQRLTAELKLTTTPIVLFVGNGFARKGLQEFLTLLAQVQQPYTAIVVGKDKHRICYEQQAHSLGIAEQVRFVGQRRDVNDFYAISDILLFPTHYEPFSNVVLEAMTLRTVVITTAQNGASEVLDPQFIMSHPTDNNIIATLDTLLRDRVWLQQIQQDNYHKAQAFSIARNVNETLMVLAACREQSG